MKRFSWKAEEETAPHWYEIQGWLPNRYLQCVLFDSICIYKPNMKGGHRHNHLSNHELRLMHTKNERKCVRKFLKKDSL